MEFASPNSTSQPQRPRDGRARGRSNGSATTPLYWQHQRAESYASVDNVKPPPIRLEDHTEVPSEHSGALWAKSVTILDYVIVSGKSGVGAYVVWNCKVETLDGGLITIRKRYSEFDDLREKLLMTFPKSGAAMPPLPPKSLFHRFQPRFLEKRRVTLSYFLNCILLNPEFSGSPVLKDFVFS